MKNNKDTNTQESNINHFSTNDEFNSSKKMWNIVIYNDENNNLEFISWLLQDKLKKSHEEVIQMSRGFQENQCIVIGTYIWEISETIKHSLEIESHKNEASLRIQLEPIA